MTPLLVLPASIIGFLLGASMGKSRRGLSMSSKSSSSPMPGVAASSWRRFVSVMVVAPKSHVSPRGRMGTFGMDARRLADVGFMDDAHKSQLGSELGVWTGSWRPPLDRDVFLSSTPAQYEAFCRSMRKMQPAASSLAGTVVDGSPATLSGLLAVGHLAGERGLASWIADPAVRKKFATTTQSFQRANGIF